MRIQNITIENTLGIRHFAADLTKPITLIAGKNGAGKSSLLQSVRYALTGEMPRINLKKDGHALVTEGAKTGRIRVQWDGDGPDQAAEVLLPGCKVIAPEIMPLATPFLVDMHRFSGLTEADRKLFMFGLTGTKASAEDVKARLIAKGADEARIDAVLPILRSGFPAANKEAASKATEAKGAWRAVTGETYGAKKAADWKAPADNGTAQLQAADTLGLKAELRRLTDGLEAENKALGAAEQARASQSQEASKLAALREKAGMVERITAKLELDRKARDEWKAKVEEARRHKVAPKSLTCPDCGASLVIDANGQLAPFTRESGDDTAAEYAENLPAHEKALALMESAVANGERDLAGARAAAESLKDATSKTAAAESDDDIAARRTLIADIKTSITKQSEMIASAESASRAATEADRKTRDAAKHHADVEGWTVIADALAPDGIPGELLAQALKPINTALAQSAADTGWPPVTLDADMVIRFGGRPYALISESEQWRCDAMLTAAIALLSGVKLALFDRFDVLDIPARTEALGWFGVLAENGEIETLIVAGTLKAMPNLPAEFQGFWLEDGSVYGTAQTLEEAA